MLYPVTSLNFIPKYNSCNNNYNKNYDWYLPVSNKFYSDTVEFTGKSLPSEYKTVFHYLSSEILGRGKKFQINNSFLSAKKIGEAIDNLFNAKEIYNNFECSDVTKVKWKNYIPQDVRDYSIEKINFARAERLKQWRSFLEGTGLEQPKNPELAAKVKNNNPLKFVIWDAITSELKIDNRHIPVPFNEKALKETIERFEVIAPKDRAVTCAKPSFIEFYTHKLRDNLLMDMGLSNRDAVWVKIPSIRHDPKHRAENIAKLEILSNKNWCTRSSVDKAEAALLDGDFYVYLKRNKSSRIWESVAGMTSLKGKIEQIQGKENDNIVPLNLLSEIKDFIKEAKLKCNSGIIDEGPKASQAILISEKLQERDPLNGRNFFRAIKDEDWGSIFEFLGVGVTKKKNGLLVISRYKPMYNVNANHGYVVPYSMFGINEESLLSQVEKIEGDFVMTHKNKLFASAITKFPQNLKSVGGKVICSKKQFNAFQDDILRVVNGVRRKVVITASD